MRQIDLSCKIAAPFFAGMFVAIFDDWSHPHHGYDLRGAALFVGGLNALALVVEYICAAKIYNDVPDLALRSSPPVLPASSSLQASSTREDLVDNIAIKLRSARFLSCTMPESLVVYFGQPICWAGFSLALLYLNVVLTFGGVMTAYLVWRGMSMEFIGLWRGVSSLAGLAGTFVYPLMTKRTGLIQVGMVSVAFQLLCLTSCYVSLFVDNRRTSFVMLIAGVCFSRLGLWVFDISVTQLMQVHIPPPIRGLVGGVQKSLNAFFTLVAYSVGLFVSDPQFFYIYASTAFAGVALAATFYAIQVYAKRNQMFSTDRSQSSVATDDYC
jgi:iron-regulated transporter 1